MKVFSTKNKRLNGFILFQFDKNRGERITEEEKRKKIVLSADIGGTNANFSIASIKDSTIENLLQKRESTESVDDFSKLVNNFLIYAKKNNFEPEIACFAVAGPIEVINGHQRVKMTNSKLVIDSKHLIENTPLQKVLIINDFEAISYAINLLGKDDYITLNKGKTVEKGVKAVVGAGTGLGKNILYFHETTNVYIPLSSEGGHSDLPIENETELHLAEFIKKSHRITTQICYEDVLSGKGLENIYGFLRATKFRNSPKDLTAAEISKTKLDNPCSKETFKWFIRFYARCARNFALDVLARGGVYIAGGIAAKNTEAFFNFYTEFIKNEVYHDLLSNIPVHIITNYDISLIGAVYALVVRKFI